MNEELTKKILEYIETTENFLSKEIPEVIQQALRYQKVSSMLCAFLSFFIAILCIRILIYFHFNPKIDKYDCMALDRSLITMGCCFTCFLMIVVFCSNIDNLLQLFLCPKFYLIKLFK